MVRFAFTQRQATALIPAEGGYIYAIVEGERAMIESV
jgi:hypothetical protein